VPALGPPVTHRGEGGGVVVVVVVVVVETVGGDQDVGRTGLAAGERVVGFYSVIGSLRSG